MAVRYVRRPPTASYILRQRDIASVFRFLKARGWSRAAIAAATGLTETRVRAISQGKQQLTSYEVLERVAAGFNIDRGLLGLGYSDGSDVVAERHDTPREPISSAFTPMTQVRPSGSAYEPWPDDDDSGDIDIGKSEPERRSPDVVRASLPVLRRPLCQPLERHQLRLEL